MCGMSKLAGSFPQNMHLHKWQAYDTWARHMYVCCNIAARGRYTAVYACRVLSQTNFAFIDFLTHLLA